MRLNYFIKFIGLFKTIIEYKILLIKIIIFSNLIINFVSSLIFMINKTIKC